MLQYQIGKWTVDPKRGTASHHDVDIHLEPKAIELLVYLASRDGEVVSRAELLDAVWPDVTVGDEVITNAVAKLRRALEGEQDSTKLIETIPKRGYRIAAAVGKSSSVTAATVSPWRWSIILVALAGTIGGMALFLEGRHPDLEDQSVRSAVPASEKPSIAVLPFANVGDSREQVYFSDGITEDLITDLSRHSSLFVISRNSSFSYRGDSVDLKNVGRRLGIQYIVKGNIRKAGNQVRINTQLIDTSTGGHIWGRRYDGELNNVFALQDKITGEIVDALAAHLKMPELTAEPSNVTAENLPSPRGRVPETQSIMAYEEFLQGWALYNLRTPQNFVEAVSHFERALERDPAYANAYAALASVYWEVWKRYWQRELGLPQNFIAWEKADHFLQQALLAPSPLAYRVSSEMLLINRHFDKAIAEAQAAIDLNPNDALGYVALANAKTFSGQADEAIALVGKAMQLDPHYPPSYLFSMALAEFSLERYREAADHLSKAIERNEGDPFWFALLIATYGQMGETEKAKLALVKLDALQNTTSMPRFTVGWPTGRWPFKNTRDFNRLKSGFLAGGMPEG